MINFEEDEKYGIRKSMVFYFYGSVNSEKVRIVEEIIENFVKQFQVEFNKKRVGDEYDYRNIRGGWQKIYHKVYDNADFSCAHGADFLEGDEEHLLNNKVDIDLWEAQRLPRSLSFLCR